MESLSKNCQVHQGDCQSIIPTLPENSIDTIITDPPYGLGEILDIQGLLESWILDGKHDKEHVGKGGFMQRKWDACIPPPAIWKEVYRVLKPGGIFKGMVYNRNSYRFRVYMPLVRRLSQSWRAKDWQSCVNEMYDGSENPYGMVYSKREIIALFWQFAEMKFHTENFSGEELLPRIGGYIPRRFWLATLGKFVGLDLYFVAKAIK